MKLIAWIILPPLAIILIAFAIANRGPVSVSFEPLPFAFEAPVYAVALFFTFLGLLIGGAAAYVKTRRWRRAARQLRRELTRVEAELKIARDAAGKASVETADRTLPVVSDAA